MNRLTARTEKGLAYLVNVKPDEQAVDSPYKNTLQCILDCFERLAHYEDLEEQGRLLVLPCKVGDCLWDTSEGFLQAFTVHFFDNDYVYNYAENWMGSYVIEKHKISDFGKTVFLARAEAEAALKGE